jgi:hypothetical protein
MLIASLIFALITVPYLVGYAVYSLSARLRGAYRLEKNERVRRDRDADYARLLRG